MLIHASCAARDGACVLVMGPPGSGKSDLVLRLIGGGFVLVADDQVMVDDGIASAPESLRGLLEVRGLGILRLPSIARASVRLVVRLSPAALIERLPYPAQAAEFDLPVVLIDPANASAPQRVAAALACATGAITQVAGAFAA